MEVPADDLLDPFQVVGRTGFDADVQGVSVGCGDAPAQRPKAEDYTVFPSLDLQFGAASVRVILGMRGPVSGIVVRHGRGVISQLLEESAGTISTDLRFDGGHGLLRYCGD
ncbi:MAG TPA: hypothetical protein VGJ59_14400 [Jatrophihabitantaceae bacterium]